MYWDCVTLYLEAKRRKICAVLWEYMDTIHTQVYCTSMAKTPTRAQLRLEDAIASETQAAGHGQYHVKTHVHLSACLARHRSEPPDNAQRCAWNTSRKVVHALPQRIMRNVLRKGGKQMT
jgi:hypothetical protein